MEMFKLSGVVTPYTGNGRKLGYPTANIPISVDAAEGLFVGTVLLEGNELLALVFIGAPITLDDNIKRAEAHILDFKDRDLYGEEVVFTVEKKLRENEKFVDVETLIEKMEQDEVEAREYFKDRL
jgi:riboflavin kinase/FMN adenylyltransferase